MLTEQRGQPYWIEVSWTATLEGHRLYCVELSCINLVTW